MAAPAQTRIRTQTADAASVRNARGLQQRLQSPGPTREPARRLDHARGLGGPSASVLQRALDAPGQPMDAPTRAVMGARIGGDFSNVRVHADAAAADSARAFAARAFAVGNHIVFGAGEYAPRSPAGRWVLAHELAHTQQASSSDDGRGARSAEPALGVAEAEANRIADTIAGGKAVPSTRRIATQVARDTIQRLSTGSIVGITIAAVAAVGAVAGLIARHIMRGRRLMHWETNAADVPMVDDPAVSPPTSTVLLPENTRVVIVDDGADRPFNAHQEQWVKVRVTVGSFLNREGWLHRNQLASRPETEVIEPEQANEIFAALSHANILTDDGSAPIPFHYPPDGCYARAHRMEELLTDMGYASEKVFALALSEKDSLVAATPYAEDKQGNKVVWGWHVAPIIKVHDPKRGIVETVLDPSLADRPITLQQWEGLMGDSTTFTRLSLSQLREELQSGHEHHKRHVVTAGRYTYFPEDLERDPGKSQAEAEDRSVRSRITGYVRDVPVYELAGKIRTELAKAVVNVKAILDAVRAAARAVRQAFKTEFKRLLAQLHQRLQADDAARVDEALDE